MTSSRWKKGAASVMAHPGAASLSIDSAELVRMPPNGRPRLGSPVGRADKVVLAAKLAAGETPLRHIYFLERPTSGRLRIAPLAPDPVRLLANSFNTYVRTPERIVTNSPSSTASPEPAGVLGTHPSGEDASSVALAVIAHMEKA